MSEIEQEILIAVISTSGIIILLMMAFLFFLQISQKRVQEKELELINEVLNTQQKEQERIARDLHDQIGPLLSIIKSQIECIDQEGLSAVDRGIKTEVVEQLGLAVNEVRSIANNLIPNTFNEYGFLKSIEYYIIRLKEFNTIHVDFICSEWPALLAKNYEISLYRILLELFQNTLKHSQAKNVKLELIVSGNKLLINYTDDGIGLDPKKPVSKGNGVKNIEARVNFLKGKYSVECVPGKSTAYHFSFNIDNLYAR